jgi:hypothetical protein
MCAPGSRILSIVTDISIDEASVPCLQVLCSSSVGVQGKNARDVNADGLALVD